MSNRLTWQTIDAPDFTKAARILDSAVANFSGGFNNAGQALFDARDRQKANRSAAAIPLLAQAASEADFNKVLSQINSTINPRDMTPELQAQILAGRERGLGYDATRLSMENSRAAAGRAAASAGEGKAREAANDAAALAMIQALGGGGGTPTATPAPAANTGGGSGVISGSGGSDNLSGGTRPTVGPGLAVPQPTAAAPAPVQTPATAAPASNALGAVQAFLDAGGDPSDAYGLLIDLQNNERQAVLAAREDETYFRTQKEQEKAAREIEKAALKEETAKKKTEEYATRAWSMLDSQPFTSWNQAIDFVAKNKALSREEREGMLATVQGMAATMPDYYAAGAVGNSAGADLAIAAGDINASVNSAINSNPALRAGLGGGDPNARAFGGNAASVAGGVDGTGGATGGTGGGTGSGGSGGSTGPGGSFSIPNYYAGLPETITADLPFEDFTAAVRQVQQATGAPEDLIANVVTNNLTDGWTDIVDYGIDVEGAIKAVRDQTDPTKASQNATTVTTYNLAQDEFAGINSNIQQLEQENAILSRQGSAAAKAKVEENQAQIAALSQQALTLAANVKQIDPTGAEAAAGQGGQTPEGTPVVAPADAASAAMTNATRTPVPTLIQEEFDFTGGGSDAAVPATAQPAAPVTQEAASNPLSNIQDMLPEAPTLPGLERVQSLLNRVRADPVQQAAPAATPAQTAETRREAATLVTSALARPETIANDPIGFVTAFAVMKDSLGPRHPLVRQAEPIVAQIMAAQRGR